MYKLTPSEWAHLRSLSRAALRDRYEYCNKKAIYASVNRDFWLAHASAARAVFDRKQDGFERAQLARQRWLERMKVNRITYPLMSEYVRRIRKTNC